MMIQTGIRRLLCSVPALALLALPLLGESRIIADMTGRKVQVPDRISRVYASSPPATYLLYAMDPALETGQCGAGWQDLPPPPHAVQLV